MRLVAQQFKYHIKNFFGQLSNLVEFANMVRVAIHKPELDLMKIMLLLLVMTPLMLLCIYKFALQILVSLMMITVIVMWVEDVMVHPLVLLLLVIVSVIMCQILIMSSNTQKMEKMTYFKIKINYT